MTLTSKGRPRDIADAHEEDHDAEGCGQEGQAGELHGQHADQGVQASRVQAEQCCEGQLAPVCVCGG